MESKQSIRQLQIRRSRVDAEIVAKSDDTSHIFDEDRLSQGKDIEVALVMEVLGHNVKGKNVESSPHEVIVEVVAHMDDHIENPVSNSVGGEESNAYADHSRGEDHIMYKRRM
jgi:wobble nucleotide-excising tRNase